MTNIAPPQQRYWKERYAEMLEMPSEKAYGVAVENALDIDDAPSSAGMVEKVARALHEAHMPWCDYTYPFEDAMSGRAVYEALASAAIAAMREPTEEMLEAGRAAVNLQWHTDDAGELERVTADVSRVFPSMIDAALTQPKEG